ncbi:DUF2637 domain-containing protein [Streptomyces zaomyceticus]|uniref:DUF2637 domain-containing protein n=1 Tax=Streptomyces zaomyceticus TaxID=68286 RepID=UPI003426F546
MLNLRSLRDPIFVQAMIAAALSFSHIHDVAEAAGQTGWKAWAYPISVDVLLAVAWKMMRTRGGFGAWFWFLVAMAASMGANIATAGVMNLADPPTWVRVAVAGWPVVAFIGGTLLVHRRRDEVAADVAPVDVPVSAPEPQEAVEEPSGDLEEEEVSEAPEEPQEPVLVTYKEAGERLGVQTETVRGWVNRKRVKRYPGHTESTVRVDLTECTAYKSRQPVGVEG